MNNTTLIRTDELERILLETTPRKAVQRAVDLIAQSILSASVTVMGVDIDQRVHFDAANGIPWSVLRKVEASFNQELPRNIMGIIRGRETCFIEDVGAYPDWRRRAASDIVSYVGFPIIIDRRVVSIINVQTSRQRLKPEDVDALRPLIHLISLIIARYLKEQQSANRENFLSLLHETTLDGVRAASAVEFMNTVVKRIARRLGYQYIALFLYDDETESLILRAQKGYTSEYDGLALCVHDHVGVVVRAFRLRHTVNVSDVSASSFYLRGVPGGRSDLALPLMVGGKVIGVLNLESKKAAAFSREDVRNLTPLAAGVGLMLASMQIKQLLREQALLDGLTGAHNRHAMDGIVVEELERARRHGHDVSFVMLDIDEFKSINDRLGHAEGDRVLETLVTVLRKSLRAIDKVIRYGGDEFLLVLPETSQRETELLLERLRAGIGTQVLTAMGAVHCSSGIATVRGDPEEGDLVQLADKRMYQAKARYRAQLEEDPGY
ncbi:sensor domain-containing diguanylate cyclase [Candidatus Cryosericum septentrionale]|jgi:diguanylate cyclase (GGDEF)-like protein|nr:sensor domain-containing diguanylate cyclase [Candidatus Cryosericum septentrionale]